ncbi:MAG: PEP-CTERM sorting domain-containing protein [Myxococcota bacterium]
MRLRTLLPNLTSPFALLVAVICATSAAAQTQPYDFTAERFSIPERGVFDDFDDGMISPAWSDGLVGSVVESGSTIRFANPGEGGFLPAPLETEVSSLAGQGVQLDFGGDFTATSVWTASTFAPSQGINLSIGSINSATGNVHQLSFGLSNTLPDVASVLGGGSGLGLSILSAVRESQAGDLVSIGRTSVPILASQITGDIHLAIAFDDANNTLQPLYSLDGGTTVVPAGAAIPWNFFGGGFALSASTTVPEPSTALLIGLGLIGLSRRSRPS